MNFNLTPELLSLIIFVFIFWYFNIRTQDVLLVPLPIENMKNVSIFDGNH
jgi:hypothetical protein